MTIFPDLRRRLLAGAALVAVAGLLGAAPPAAGQGDEPLPCGVGYDRTVSPGQVAAEDSVRVKITVTGGDCAADGKGADVFFIVDATPTMFENRLIQPTKEALRDFVSQMNFANSSAGLISFAAEETVKSNLSRDRVRLLTAIQQIPPEQEDDVRGLSSALRVATQKLDNDGTPGNEKMVIVVIAGPDIGNQLVDLPSVTNAAKLAGVKFAFLMWFENRAGRARYEARYSNYVEAATFCADNDTQCPNWTLGRRWAWPVALEDSAAYSWDERIGPTMDLLAERLLRPLAITSVEIREVMHSGADFLQASAQPPPTGGNLREPLWSFPAIPAGGITIEYDARMIFGGETYPPTTRTELAVGYSDGQVGQRNLPNPPVVVIEPMGTPTPTISPSRTPSPSPSDTPVAPSPTATQVEATPTPITPTPAVPTEDPGGARLYLPAALQGWDGWDWTD